MMIPWAVTIIPQYEMFTNWGLQDTYTSLVLPGMISAFGIFLFRQSISGISDELIEAAKLDGASETRIFHSIILPMSHNTIAALAIFTFLWNWEDYLWPFLMITDENKQLLAVGLRLQRTIRHRLRRIVRSDFVGNCSSDHCVYDFPEAVHCRYCDGQWQVRQE